MHARRTIAVALAVALIVSLLAGSALAAPPATPQASPHAGYSGCRLTEGSTVSQVFGSLGGPHAYELDVQLLWCARGGVLSTAKVMAISSPVGHIPFWKVTNDSAHSFQRGGVGYNRWVVHEAVTATWACLPVVTVCLHTSATFVELSVDATIGQVSIACGFPNCAIRSDQPLA